MITPDYRSDINVQPLNIAYTEDTQKHLAIIHLPERYFYDPESAIMLLSHEIGHYEGDRNREYRARSIFYLVGMTLLKKTDLFPDSSACAEPISQGRLLGILADEFGAFLFEQFNSEFQHPNRNIAFQLTDISNFLECHQYGNAYFADAETNDEISTRWKVRLYKDDCIINSEITHILNEISKASNTPYFANLANANTPHACIEPVAQYIADTCSLAALSSDVNRKMETIILCDSLIQAFGEAYADMQMIRICGQEFCRSRYGNLINTINNNRKKNTPQSTGRSVEQIIRYHAICKAFNFPAESIPEITDKSLIHAAIECVHQYILKCYESYITDDSSPCSDFVRGFIKANPFERCEWISNFLGNYKSEIVEIINSSNLLTEYIS